MTGESILIVEDDPTLLRGLKDNFESRGYSVTTAADGEAGLQAALAGPDLILLDIMLPKVNGFEICRAVREQELDMPIIMLTAKGQEDDIVRGLDLGADDYVTKPFSIRELLSRANAFLRRKDSGDRNSYEFGECRLDLSSHQLFRDGGEVELTPKEFALLEYLVRNTGRALTRDQILDRVWDGVMVTTRSVDRCVTTLRKKVEGDPRYPVHIQTIRDVGYRFEMPEAGDGSGAVSGTGAGATLVVGSLLGRYEILGLLGTGGMSEVYRARDQQLGREVAIKVMPRALGRNQEAQKRFKREVRVIAALSHPGILAIYDTGRDRGLSYAVTELLEGESLEQRLARGPLEWQAAVALAAAVAEALAAAHAKGIVHRDVKPGNVFLPAGGGTKVLDFGLARIDDDRGRALSAGSSSADLLTTEGQVMGTVAYMSPEQVRGRPADARSDIFSLGCVLHEMINGAAPFRRASVAETMGATLKDGAPELAAGGTALPERLERLVLRCLEKSSGARFQSAGDLAFALSEFVAGS